MSSSFTASLTPPDNIQTPCWWFIFHQQQMLLIPNHPQPIPLLKPTAIQQLPLAHIQYLGVWRQHHCFTAIINELITPPLVLQWQPIKQLLHHFCEETFCMVSRALQILHFNQDHQFCGRCATALIASNTELAKICPHCHFIHYPRLSPSIIVVIKRNKKILLARSSHFTKKFYSALAGFIEPGETAEQAVHREVLEEVGLKIKNIRYHFSQSWPFPHSFLLGFSADYAAGEINIDGVEIEDAQWFTADYLPLLPPPLSISYQLIQLSLNH